MKEKRARAPRNVVLDMIFDQFNDRPQISTKELIEITGQPQRYLKDILSSVAVLRNGIWMLKDEFFHRKSRQTALASLPVSRVRLLLLVHS